MSFIADIIKIELVNAGYLPNFPYHLISDEEMFNAFINDTGECLFDDYYPCPEVIPNPTPMPDIDIVQAYEDLRNCIKAKISDHFQSGKDVPDWVYSYMLLRPISYGSSESDIAYLYNLLDITNNTGQFNFTSELAYWCYYYSKLWISKKSSSGQSDDDRVPTMFGETHVTKSLRLIQSNILMDYEGNV